MRVASILTARISLLCTFTGKDLVTAIIIIIIIITPGAAYPAPFAQQNPEKTYTCTAFAALSFYFTSTLFSHSSHINESAIMYILVHTQLYTEVG